MNSQDYSSPAEPEAEPNWRPSPAIDRHPETTSKEIPAGKYVSSARLIEFPRRPFRSEDEALFDWLKREYEFVENPFIATDAERDTFLRYHYLAVPAFSECLHRCHTVVVAAPGSGKTALLLALERHFQDSFIARRVLCVTHRVQTDGTDVPVVDRERTCDSVIRSLARYAFVALAQFGYALKNDLGGQYVRNLAGWFDQYLSATTWRSDLREGIETGSLRQILSTLSFEVDESLPPALEGTISSSWLRTWHDALTREKSTQISTSGNASSEERLAQFTNLLTNLGIRDIYLGIDGIDPSDGEDPQKTVRTHLEPYLDWLSGRKVIPHLYLKLFMPNDLGDASAVRRAFDFPDNLILIELRWKRAQLRELLRARLEFASDGVVRSLNQLVAAKGRDLDRIVIDGGYERRGRRSRRVTTPRELLHRTRSLLVEHGVKATRLEKQTRATAIDWASATM